MIFECEAMASRDNNGNLQSCSVFWCDPHVMWENVIDRTGRVMVFAGIGGAIFGVLSMAAKNSTMQMAVAGVAAIAAGLMMVYYCGQLPGRERLVMFMATGEIDSPLGLANNGNSAFRWRKSWREIVNFESEQVRPTDKDGYVGYTHAVRAVTRSGDVLHVATHMAPNSALKLATNLMSALQTVREEAASVGSARSRVGRYID